MNFEDVEIKRPPVLFDKTQALIGRLEKEIEGTFLTYWNSENGSVCHHDVVALYEILQALGPQERIHLFIKSGGGHGQASLRIVNLLWQYTQGITALIPLECASAATMIALGADEVRMGPLAYLTAVDTSLRHALSPIDYTNSRVNVSQDELVRIIRLWGEEAKENDQNPYGALFQYVHPLVIGAIDRAKSLSIRLCHEILAYHVKDEEQAEAISQYLNSNYPSHNYPITLQEAEKIGLHVTPLDPHVSELLFQLNALYSEMGQRALTDYDERNYHDNEILNIIEGQGIQILYQSDKDWHYRQEERRWISLNDQSNWYRLEMEDGEMVRSEFFIR
jgi:hypothetical protein